MNRQTLILLLTDNKPAFTYEESVAKLRILENMSSTNEWFESLRKKKIDELKAKFLLEARNIG